MLQKNIDYPQAIKLAQNRVDQAFFIFSQRCEICSQFIPDAADILRQYINDNIYFIEADEVPFPPAEVPVLYLFRSDLSEPKIRVGVAPKELVENDFQKFYRKV